MFLADNVFQNSVAAICMLDRSGVLQMVTHLSNALLKCGLVTAAPRLVQALEELIRASNMSAFLWPSGEKPNVKDFTLEFWKSSRSLGLAKGFTRTTKHLVLDGDLHDEAILLKWFRFASFDDPKLWDFLAHVSGILTAERMSLSYKRVALSDFKDSPQAWFPDNAPSVVRQGLQQMYAVDEAMRAEDSLLSMNILAIKGILDDFLTDLISEVGTVMPLGKIQDTYKPETVKLCTVNFILGIFDFDESSLDRGDNPIIRTVVDCFQKYFDGIQENDYRFYPQQSYW